jgi:quercetin dioxygenase-like cupin family protein
VIVLDPTAPPARPERWTTRIVHDEPSVRIIAFSLLPGQTVPPHHSPSTVTVQVVAGRGRFAGAEGEIELEAGGMAVYAPEETHAITALDVPLRFLAVITPRPG